MSIVEQNISIAMIRPTLTDLPLADLPPGYDLTWYKPGDEQHWVQIHVVADRYNTITPALFVQQFGIDPAMLSQRQFYLRTASGSIVGTASAWFDGNIPNTPVGRVHWVAILPEYQGRGLAKPLLARVCHRLQQLGHHSAILTTSTARVPAINLYLQFGFVPTIETMDDLQAWRDLIPHLSRPVPLPPLP